MSGFYTYILRCADGTLYTGWTVDPIARLAAHNSGKGARYTRGRLPVEMVWCEKHEDNAAARSREAKIKRLTRAEKLELINEKSINSQLSTLLKKD